METTSLYIHIPFCIHRCYYCDFNTYSNLDWLIPEYIEALCIEAQIISRTASLPFHVGTIYFGGGTPSLLESRYIDQIIETIAKNFIVETDAEITVEVNPGTTSQNYFKGIYKSGVNRLSIGMQSSNPQDLAILGRIHDYSDVIHTVEWSRKVGFENINLDLIFGVHGQSINRWKNTLELALELDPDHFSIYALTIEDRTPMGRWYKHGLIDAPDPDIGADMYEWASKALFNHLYYQYEISNWAKLDVEGKLLVSRHNMQYWKNLSYIGFGAGAHSYVNNSRVVNLNSPVEYVNRLRKDFKGVLNKRSVDSKADYLFSPVCVECVTIDKKTEMSETMMMGLRLVNQGISKTRFLQRFRLPLEDVYGVEIEKLVNIGLLEWTPDHEIIHLTKKGCLLGNQVFLEFV